jgi:glyceraldehyde-3-phosphate dehydrogenase (NADP+)
MKATRQDVVKLLMGNRKIIRRFRKEFDRTVEYIYDTIASLKELNTRSAIFLKYKELMLWFVEVHRCIVSRSL